MGRRMDYVDMARGIAIILVMTGHSILFPACGAIHIPTFFVLSGYVVTMESVSKHNLSSCIRKRAGRLIYPYAFYSLILFLMRVAKDILAKSFSMAETFKNAFGVLYSSTYIFNREENNFLCFRIGNEGLWFLTAMICGSIVFYGIVYKYLKVTVDYTRVAVACVILILTSWLLNFSPVYLPWGFDIALLGTVFMFFGVLLREWRMFEDKRKALLLTIVGAVGFTICHFLNGQANMAIHLYGKNLLIFMMSGCFSSVALIGACRLLEELRPLQKGLSYVGQNTLFILAFHTMVFGVFDKVFHIVGIAFPGLWVLRLTLTLMVCLVGQLVLEKIFRVPRKFL